MANTGIRHFDRSVQKTNEMIGDVMQRTGIRNREKAYIALRGTLQELRDRLTVNQSANLASQFPLMVQGVYYDNWNPSRVPVKISKGYVFASRVHSHLKNDPEYDPDAVVRGVFSVLADRISVGKIEDVKSVLPDDIAKLWP